MSAEEYKNSVEEIMAAKALPEIRKDLFNNLCYYGCAVIHEPTGISGYSIEDVNEKLKLHYKKIIDKHLQFTHVMKALK